MTEGRVETRADGVLGGDARYSTFLSLSGDGIARFEVDPPLQTGGSEDEQVGHILRHSRVAECNDQFASFYGRPTRDMTGAAMGDFVPSDDPARLHGIREFIRADYRMVYVEEEHERPDFQSRWLSASALGAPQDGRLREFWVCLRDITARKRSELDRERRGHILEALAFSSARLLQPGSWRDQAPEVLAKLGQAAQAARAWIGERLTDADGSSRILFRFTWEAPGLEPLVDDALMAGGLRLGEGAFGWLAAELRAGRPVVRRLAELSEDERRFLSDRGSKGFAGVPIFANGVWWGVLGFGETRYEREWSGPEIEALKAAAAVLGAAIEREGSDVALRESEERFRRLAAATFEGIDITEDGMILDVNEQFARMVRGEVEDLIGHRSLEFVPPESKAVVQARLEEFSEEPYHHLVRRCDGSVFPVEVRSRTLPLGGRTVRISAVRDVTERVRAEERQRLLEADLRQAAEQWRQTFDALDLGVVLADAQGQVVRLNRSALELAARQSFADAVGAQLDELSTHEPWKSARQIHRQVGDTGATATGEIRDGPEGRAYYLLGSPWFRGEGEAPWRVITFRDVTDFTRMQGQLRRAQTLEAMGTLVAGVAHEVRNPLFSISASVDALEAVIGERPEVSECAQLLRSQVTRLNQLMRDLLDYGKPSMLRIAPTHLGDLLRRASRTCVALARDRDVAVEERLAASLPALALDGARVEQVLENLIANAIQHSPRGSRVTVTADLETADPGASVRCVVEDEGPGLPPEDVAKVFEPFFSRRKGGTGLGLSIVQRIVEAHGGRITAGNREEGGARFVVRMPALSAPEESPLG